MPRERAPTHVRFLRYFREGAPDECWEWWGNKNGAGYGLLRDAERGQRKVLAHRYAYEQHHGVTLPPGQGAVVQHTCDNPACVNPAHLRLGTMLTNTQDMDRKGRRRPVWGGNNPPRHIGETHPRAKLTEAEALQIRAMHAAGVPRREIVRQSGRSLPLIKSLLGRKTWRHI